LRDRTLTAVENGSTNIYNVVYTVVVA